MYFRRKLGFIKQSNAKSSQTFCSTDSFFANLLLADPFFTNLLFVDPFFANLLLLGPLLCESSILRAPIICDITIVARLISNNNRYKTSTKDSRAVLKKKKKVSTCITAAIVRSRTTLSLFEGYLSKFRWRGFPGFVLPRSSVDSLIDRDEATDPNLGTSGLTPNLNVKCKVRHEKISEK